MCCLSPCMHCVRAPNIHARITVQLLAAKFEVHTQVHTYIHTYTRTCTHCDFTPNPTYAYCFLQPLAEKFDALSMGGGGVGGGGVDMAALPRPTGKLC